MTICLQYLAYKQAKHSETSRGENLTRISALVPAAISPEAGLTLNGMYVAAASACDVTRGTGSRPVKAAVSLCVGDGDASTTGGEPDGELLPPCCSESDPMADEPLAAVLPGLDTLPLAGI